MSVSSLALDSSWRDYNGAWNPSVEPFVSPLELSKCHAPRLVLLPSLDVDTATTIGGKTTYSFHLVPGSVIWGVFVGTDQANVIQITDVGIGHALFQDPVNCQCMAATGFSEGNGQSFFILPRPWPVSGDGLFTLEVWTTGIGNDPFYMLLGVGEVTTCQVRS